MTVAGDRLSAGLARRYRQDFGISVAEWRVLVHLADEGAVSIRDLERRVSLEKSKASRAAARLAQDGYITKIPNPEDRRLLRLSLSDKGRALMAELLPLAADYQARLEALLSEELDALHRALDRVMAEDL
nr:MarR family transcriptional regulator [Roseivivax sp. GX 12232]